MMLILLTDDLERSRQTHDEIRERIRQQKCFTTDQIDYLTRVKLFFRRHSQRLAVDEHGKKRSDLD